MRKNWRNRDFYEKNKELKKRCKIQSMIIILEGKLMNKIIKKSYIKNIIAMIIKVIFLI